MTAAREPFVLPRRLTGQTGVESVEALLMMSDGPVQIDASTTVRVDALSATVLRAGIERLTCGGRENDVWIKRPTEPRAASLFCGLLGEMPENVDVHGGPTHRMPHRDVLLAATRIHDDRARDEASRTLRRNEESYTARGLVKPGRLLVEAFNEFVDNAMKYGMSSDVDAVAAACATHHDRLQFAVFNCAESPADGAAATEVLRDHVRRSEQKPGAFYGAVRSAKYPSTLQLMTGNARLRWCQRVEVTEVPGSLTGYLAALEVDL